MITNELEEMDQEVPSIFVNTLESTTFFTYRLCKVCTVFLIDFSQVFLVLGLLDF